MAVIIKVKAGDKRAVYLIRDDKGEISCTGYKGYEERAKDQNFVVDEYYELLYPTDAVCPMCILDLGRIAPGMTTHSDKQTENFKMAVTIAQAAVQQEREAKGLAPKTPSAAIKALMLFNADENTNSYDKDVYMWDSVNGVQRCSFAAYLKQVEAKHDAQYRLAKLSMLRVQGIALSDFKHMKAAHIPMNGDKTGTMKMVFRSLWYAATGEEMSI